jgi:preprotein translocase subunit SecG
MEIWQIILAIIIVGLSIVMPIYYSYKKKKLAQQLKEGKEVTEREKMRVYIDSINQKFRDKHK